jgi:hypothetical protein
MHASYKKWIEGFVFGFTLVLALIFEYYGFVKIMCMFGDQPSNIWAGFLFVISALARGA